MFGKSSDDARVRIWPVISDVVMLLHRMRMPLLLSRAQCKPSPRPSFSASIQANQDDDVIDMFGYSDKDENQDGTKHLSPII